MYYHHHAVALGEDKIDKFFIIGNDDIHIQTHFTSEWFYELREEDQLNSKTKQIKLYQFGMKLTADGQRHVTYLRCNHKTTYDFEG